MISTEWFWVAEVPGTGAQGVRDCLWVTWCLELRGWAWGRWCFRTDGWIRLTGVPRAGRWILSDNGPRDMGMSEHQGTLGMKDGSRIRWIPESDEGGLRNRNFEIETACPNTESQLQKKTLGVATWGWFTETWVTSYMGLREGIKVTWISETEEKESVGNRRPWD